MNHTFNVNDRVKHSDVLDLGTIEGFTTLHRMVGRSEHEPKGNIEAEYGPDVPAYSIRWDNGDVSEEVEAILEGL